MKELDTLIARQQERARAKLMKGKVVHLKNGDWPFNTHCGSFIAPAYNGIRIVEDSSKVTCKRCQLIAALKVKAKLLKG